MGSDRQATDWPSGNALSWDHIPGRNNGHSLGNALMSDTFLANGALELRVLLRRVEYLPLHGYVLDPLFHPLDRDIPICNHLIVTL